MTIERKWHRRIGSALIAGLLGLGIAAQATAQTASQPAAKAVASPRAADERAGSGGSYITPFPENDTYRIQVYGDAFADGMLGGLTDALASDPRLQLPKRPRTLAGIARPEFEDEARAEEALRETVHVAVVMVGVADRTQMRVAGGKRLDKGTDEWRAEYGRRVDRLLRLLKARGAAIYWVGLPITRRGDANDDFQEMNELTRERAFLNGARYIDIYAGFQDESGGYNQFGPDQDGKLQKLREGDGVLFTPAGNRKLAHYVARDLQRDLAQAKADRNIPLAGSEVEQKRLSPQQAVATAATAPAAGWKGVVKPEPGVGPQAKAATGAPAAVAVDTSGDQKAESARIGVKSMAGGREETVTMEIVRPALSGAVIALVTRREAGDRVALLGDTLIEDAEGDILLNSLGSLTEDAGQGSGGRRRTLRAGAGVNFRALVKGERLATKPGRADDFSWPKPEPPPLVPAAASAAGAKAATDAQRPAAAKARARGQNQN